MGQYYSPISIDKKEHVCAHDYDNGLKLMEHSYIGNNFVSTVAWLLSENGGWYKTKFVWAGDYADSEDGTEDGGNLYTIIDKKINPPPKKDYIRFVINHTKRQYVDLNNVELTSRSEWKIHPLPLLTCEGNGRGFGDFNGEDPRIGYWARDVISTSNNYPDGYIQINGNFKEY